MMLNTIQEVFRSWRKADCEELAFVLTAVGIPNHVHFDGWHYVLTVEDSQYEAAIAQLRRYVIESRPLPPPPPPQKLFPFALVGCVVYAAILVFVGYAVAGGLWRLDAFDVGAIDAA